MVLSVKFPSQNISMELFWETGHDRADVPDDSQSFFLTTSLHPLSFSNNVYISTICMKTARNLTDKKGFG